MPRPGVGVGAQRAVKLGADVALHKPFAPRDLLQIIENLLPINDRREVEVS